MVQWLNQWVIGKPTVLLVAIATLAVILTACNSGVTNEVEVPRGVAVENEAVRVIEADRPAGSLTIYSGRSETLAGPIIQQFSAVTGIPVKVKYAGTSQLAATLLEEGTNSPADLFFAQDPGGLGAVEEMLIPLPEDLLDLVPPWARSPDGTWVGISGRARTVVYNSEKLTEADLPDDVFALSTPSGGSASAGHPPIPLFRP